MKGTLLGAAASALAVKQALTGPLVIAAQPQLDQVKESLDEKAKSAVKQAQVVLVQTEGQLAGVLVNPSGSASQGLLQARASRNSQSMAPVRHAEISDAPPPLGSRPHSRALVHKILREAALRHGIDPKLVLALSYWESGWDQSRVSETGAIGLMQVEPGTAQEAGPALLGHAVDLNDPYDNADVGCAILRADLDAFKEPSLALAAYYQGPTSLREYGMLPDTSAYVEGIEALATQQNP